MNRRQYWAAIEEVADWMEEREAAPLKVKKYWTGRIIRRLAELSEYDQFAAVDAEDTFRARAAFKARNS